MTAHAAVAMNDQSPFIYRAHRVELSYEAAFRAPAFDLPSRNVQLLRSLHEEISPHFPININSMQIAGGQTLGDVKIRGLLLNNNAFLEIGSQKISAVFSNIVSREDVDTVKKSIVLIEEAFAKVLPEITLDQRRFDIALHAEIEGGRGSISQIIQRVASPSAPIEIGASNYTVGIVTNYEHQEENWRMTLMLDTSLVLPEGLFIQLRAFYACDGALKSFQAQEAHLTTAFEKLFRGLNLRAAED